MLRVLIIGLFVLAVCGCSSPQPEVKKEALEVPQVLPSPPPGPIYCGTVHSLIYDKEKDVYLLAFRLPGCDDCCECMKDSKNKLVAFNIGKSFLIYLNGIQLWDKNDPRIPGTEFRWNPKKFTLELDNK